jgi:hypothetical protein
MRFLRSDAVQLTPSETVFRQSVGATLAATLFLFAAALALLAAGAAGALPIAIAAVGGGSLLLFGALSARMLTRSRAPANWLVAFNGRRLLIKFRSYLNPALAPDVPDVVELPLSEVEGVRAARQEVTGWASSRELVRKVTTFLDLRVGVGVSLAELAEHLRRERELRSSGATWRHYPVSVPDERTIRIEWRSDAARVTPGIDEALRLLGADAPGAPARMPEERERVELGGVGRRLDPAAALRDVRTLAEHGRIVDATTLAMRAFGWSTTRAREFVEQLAASRG